MGINVESRFTTTIIAFVTLVIINFLKEVFKMTIETSIGFITFWGSIGAEGKSFPLMFYIGKIV